jgi:tetratricopeptide (TPR) repeat protein
VTSGRAELAAALAIAALGVALYLPTLGHGYALDDLFVVQENPVVAELRWREAPVAPWWPPRHGVDWRASNWRPLAMLSLLLERAAAPGAAPRLHHLGNALLHGALVLALFPLARRLAGPGWPALAACALFAVHPAHVEAAAPVVGRSDLLGALGLLLALEAFLRHRGTGSRRWLALAALAFGLGLAGKESAAPLLVLLPLADVLLRGEPVRALATRRRLAAYLPFAAVAAAYAAARFAVLGKVALVHGQAGSYGLVGRLVFAARNAAVSLWLLAFPNRTHHLLTTLPTDAPVTYPLPEGLAAAGFALVALAIGAGWIALWRAAPRGAFAWLAALLTWLPTSGLAPTGSGVALRFLLLPSAFAACGVARALAAAARAGGAGRARAGGAGRALAGGAGRVLATAAACLAVAAGAATTLRRVPAWRDNGTLLGSVVAEEPDCYTALFGLGRYLESLPEPDRVRARALYRHAIEIAPAHTGGLEARVNLAESYARAGETEDALATYAGAIAAAPGRFEPRLNRALLLAQLGRTREALADFDRAMELNPAFPDAARFREQVQAGRRRP